MGFKIRRLSTIVIIVLIIMPFITVYANNPHSRQNEHLPLPKSTNKCNVDYSLIRSHSKDIDKLEKINKAISKKDAKWVAGETKISRYNFEDQTNLVGAKFKSIPIKEEKLKAPLRFESVETFDWRDVNGINWMTPVRYQGACGSCWAFGTTSSMESMINIVYDNPTIDIDLSEQTLISCSGCGDCEGGWPQDTYDYIKNTGIPDEACFPYQAANAPCNICPDWEERAWYITDFEPVFNDTDSIKWALKNYGPLGVGMYASDDFLYYMSGIYEPVYASSEWNNTFPFGSTNHWVTLVGYNDVEEYWIIKNSWGWWWGSWGYGKIAYGVLEKHDSILAITSVEGPTNFEHDLAVSIQDPIYLLPGNDSVLNITVYNEGQEEEVDLDVRLFINGTEVMSEVIPVLANDAFSTLSYPWIPSLGQYNVTAYVDPVTDENYIFNNRESKLVKVSYTPTHIGDLVVDGDDVLIIEDVNFTQMGNIYVQDDAGLIIRNATLNLDQDYYNKYEIMVSDSAWLLTEDSYIVSEYQFDISLVGNAEGCLNSTYNIGYIYMQNNSTLNVYGSNLWYLYFEDYSTGSFYLSDLGGIYCVDYSDVSVYDSDINFSIYVLSWGSPDVLLQGCTVGHPKLGFWVGYSLLDPTKDVLIHKDEFLETFADEKGIHPHMLNETTPDMMQSWHDYHWRDRILKESDPQYNYSDGTSEVSSSAVVTLTDLSLGYIGFWNIHKNETVSGVDWNLTLVDTIVIDGWDIGCYGDSEVSIYESTIRYLDSDYSSTVSVYNSTLRNLDSDYSSTVSIYDSLIEWGVYVSPWGSSDVYLEGCVLNYLGIGFIDYSSAYLRDIHPGYIGLWNIHTNEIVSGVDWNLTLVDTMVIDGWDLLCSDYSEVYLLDSTLNYIDCWYSSVVSIYDSTVRYLDSYDYSLVSVYNSTVYGLGCYWFTGQLFFDETIVDGWWNVLYSEFYISGGVNFTNLWFFDSNVTRNYGVKVTMKDARAPDITLTLYDEGETPIWIGITDDSGLSTFNMTLNDDNYATIYSLRTYDYPEERNVSLISKTPILICVRRHEIPLFMGWNLIGLPCTPEDPNIDALLFDIIDYVDCVWAYDGETKKWFSYSPGAPSDLTEMHLGKGYWMHMNNDITWLFDCH